MFYIFRETYPMALQDEFFKYKIMGNNEVILTNTIYRYKLMTREKTWAGDDSSIYPLKKIFCDYDVYFQNDGSISLQLIVNNFNIPLHGINWNFAPSPTNEYLFEAYDVETDGSPYYYLKGNQLVFVSNPTIPTVLSLGSWKLTLVDVDPSAESSLWISNENLNLFAMNFYFNETIQYHDYIQNDFMIEDKPLIKQLKFIPQPMREAYSALHMIVGSTPQPPTPMPSQPYLSAYNRRETLMQDIQDAIEPPTNQYELFRQYQQTLLKQYSRYSKNCTSCKK
jgi:hypothetical protein